MPQAELYDGTVLDFEDGTPLDVIQRVSKEQTQRLRTEEARRPLPEGTKPSTAGAGRGEVAPPAEPPAPAPGPAPAPWSNLSQPFKPVNIGGRGTAPTRAPQVMPEGGSVLDRPSGTPTQKPAYTPEQIEEGTIAPAKLEQVRRERALAARGPQEAKPLSPDQTLAVDLQDFTKNPVARGAVGGFSSLGKVGTGAVRLAADLAGAESVAKFAASAGGTASTLEAGSTSDLKAGNDKLVADVTSSIINSVPSMALGAGGGPALKALFAQSALQEYGTGRDTGFGVEESLARAGIMGAAEAIGERFGFPEQIRLLKGVVRNLPPGEMAKTLGELIKKEIPGEQLTTAMQFLADKMGPAAQNPNATLADYLEQAGETLKVTVAQTAVMGGGPAAISQGKEQLARADQAVDRSSLSVAERLMLDKFGANPYAIANARGFVVDPPLQSDTPKAQRNKTTAIFDSMAAKYGIPPGAVSRAKTTAEGLPYEDLASFYAKFVRALQKRDLVGAPVEQHAIDALEAGPVVLPEERAAAEEEAKATEAATKPAKTETKRAPAAPAPAERATAAQAVDNMEGILGGASTIDEAARQTATSPHNDLQEPSDEQKAAGNYQKGHDRIAGLDVSIENDEGSTRRSRADAPVQWESEMKGAHYGYFRGTVGMDTVDPDKPEQIDTFIKSGTPRDFDGTVFVVDQVDPKTGKPDEHKVMLGFDSISEAKKTYLNNYQKGWKGLGAITAVPMADFKTWLKGDTSKPFSSKMAAAPPPAGAIPKGPAPEHAAGAPAAAGGGATTPVTFKTAKGSTYVVNGQSTTRDKAARADVGHEGDSGLKSPSVKTVYVDTDASVLSAAGIQGLGKRGARVVVKDGKATLLTWNEAAGGWGAAPTSRGISVHDAPAVGRHPLELWSPKDDVPGYEAYGAMHAGNKITEIIGGGKTSAPQPDVPAAAGGTAAPPAGRGDQPGGGGRTVGPVPAVDAARDAGRAAAPAPSAGQDQPARPAGLANPPVGPRVIGKVGVMPKNAQPLELRANKDGTLTPWLEGHELLDFESAEPVVLKADATDREALDAIKDSGALGRRMKVFAEAAEGEAPPAEKRGKASTARSRMAFNPETDSVLQAVAKMGGIRRDIMAREFGLRPEELKHTVSAGNLKGYPFRAKDGLELDRVLENLKEHGYFPGVAREDLRNAFEGAVYGELGGDHSLTAVGQMRKASEAYNERAAQEMDPEALAEREAIMDEAGASEADMRSLDDDDLDLSATGNASVESFMRGMGFTEKEIADETAKQAGDAQAGAAEDRPPSGQKAGAPPRARGPEARPEPAGADEGLTSPTPAGLQAQAERAAAAERADKAEQKRLADKAKADAERGEFTLTGSNRPADVAAAAGQTGLFEQPAAAPAPPAAPAAKTVEQTFRETIELKKRLSVLQSLAKCLS